ncbi:PilN domain-containing protein [Ideonella dechloratans]|uniref:PilN domain-containing protein n=1 Tax=Ideonella dechloratans TaxID=36863 RepID=A0A643FFK8_IDEDE|nr:PilN domain-containing protein [Ideonella dechloratans]KAB0584395.1 PilN domain-containing protein [Ideonella dechloratans]UFU10832.1 PilN domain-containing protein [Ideonella dechloratans]
MILINLLPHREAKRQARKRAFFSTLGLAALIGAGVLMLWYGLLQQMISTQEGRNAFLKAEIAQLDIKIKDIADLKAEIEALKARQNAVENLQTDRNVPVYLLNELVKQTPEGVYLTTVRQLGTVVTLTGKAETNERVSEFLRNTLYNSPWLERPELVEIKAAANPPGRAANPRRLFDFSMKVYIKQPAAAADAASKPAAGKPAGKQAPKSAAS